MSHLADVSKRMSRSKAALGILALLAFLMVYGLSLAQFRAFNNVSFDLTRIGEAMWQTLQGKPLYYTSEGPLLSRLADHVEIAYLLLVPLYGIMPTPKTLLLVQALLFASGSWPVFDLARRRLESERMALLFAAIYLLYPVAQTAVLFEFHGDTLAMPLLLFALNAVDRGSLRAYAVWLFVALLCKVYVAAPVLVMGIVLLFQGRRKAGGYTVACALGWGLIAFFGIRGMFAPEVGADVAKATAQSYVDFYFSQLGLIGDSWQLRLIHGSIVLLPALLLGRRGWPWLIVASSVILPVLASSGPGPVYSYEYHHYALAVPFLLMAMIDGAHRVKKQELAAIDAPKASQGARWHTAVVFTLLVTLFLNLAAVDTPLSPRFYLASPGSGWGRTDTGYGVQKRDLFMESWIRRQIPGDATVAADRTIAQRLSNQHRLYLSHPSYVPQRQVLAGSELVAVDALYDYALGDEQSVVAGGVATEHDTISALLQDEQWQLQNSRDGLVLFSRSGAGLDLEATAQHVEELPALMADFDQQIGLTAADVERVGERRYRLWYGWVALQDLDDGRPLIAVTRLAGIPFSRIVHLPTIGLQPTTDWSRGTFVRESLEFEIPEETTPGSYDLYTGWYRTDSIYSSKTDERTRIGTEVFVGKLEVH